jgi:hypothetical protein
MSGETWAQIAVGVFGVASAAIPVIGNRQQRRNMRHDLKADFEMLPLAPEGPLRAKLEAQISWSLDEIAEDRERRRDPFGIVLALCLIGASVAVGIFAIKAGGFWLLALAPAGILGIVSAGGLAQDSRRLKRNPKGNPDKTT